MWQEILGPGIELKDAWGVVMAMIRLGDREDPPPAGEIYAQTKAFDQLRRSNQAAAQLEAPKQRAEYRPGERRVTPSGVELIANEEGVLRPAHEKV